MRKIPTLFKRDETDRRYVTDEVTPGCEWVLAGEGVPTRKWDGTCMMLDNEGRWWARREVKPGKTPPAGFVLVNHDDVTGKDQGWEPAVLSPFSRFMLEATEGHGIGAFEPGTYELCGPKVNGNPEKLARHQLIQHGETVLANGPRGVHEIRAAVGELPFEGVVWHHPDGRMAKLKRRDIRP